MRHLVVAACCVLCGAAGYLVGTKTTATEARTAPPARGEHAAERSLPEPPAAPERTEPAAAAAEPSAQPSAEPDADVESILARLFPGEPVPQRALDRARELCKENLGTAALRAAGQAFREEQDRREVTRMETAGDMPRMLETLAGKSTTVPDLAADADRFLALLRAPAKGPTVSEPDLTRVQSGEIEDGTTVLLPKGTLRHRWDRRKPFPIGLTLSGMSPEDTILNTEIDPEGPILALTLENMTVTSQRLVDARKALTLILRNVRAAGYNTGAGGSTLFDIRVANFALYAEDCVFDGSVGRGGSQHGTPFSLSGPAKILRFTRCTFLENSAPVRLWGTATIHFERCRFVRNREAHVKGAVYRDCTFESNGDDS